MFNIVAIGELLIDFTPTSNEQGIFYKQNAGGAPCNMLTMAAKLGSKTAFIGKVGDDSFGRFLGRVLVENEVNSSGLIYTREHGTTLAFVHLDSEGERGFSFYRRGCADVMLTNTDVNYQLVDSSQALHFGSLSFTTEPCKSTVERVVSYAKKRGKLITYDPNYRPALWNNQQVAKEAMAIGLKYADIIKVSAEEARILTDESDLEKAGRALNGLGIGLICITLGEKGAFYFHSNGCGTVKGYEASVIDTTGAGDAFLGAVVHQILDKEYAVKSLEPNQIREIFNYANAAASICVQRLGGIPAMPARQEIDYLLAGIATDR